MKLETTRPYAKLADCAGKKFLGACSEGHGMGMVLAFEDAWACLMWRDRDDEGGQLEDYKLDPEFYTFPFDQLGLVAPGALAAYREQRQAAEAVWQEKRDREQYERLKQKFEGAVNKMDVGGKLYVEVKREGTE